LDLSRSLGATLLIGSGKLLKARLDEMSVKGKRPFQAALPHQGEGHTIREGEGLVSVLLKPIPSAEEQRLVRLNQFHSRTFQQHVSQLHCLCMLALGIEEGHDF
jgi:hypothetical protein